MSEFEVLYVLFHHLLLLKKILMIKVNCDNYTMLTHLDSTPKGHISLHFVEFGYIYVEKLTKSRYAFNRALGIIGGD